MHKITASIPYLLIAVTFVLGCGRSSNKDPDNFDKQQLKGNLQSFNAEQQKELNNLSRVPINELTEEEQNKLTDLLIEMEGKGDLRLLLRRLCYTNSLHGGDKCAKERDQCLDHVNKQSIEELKAQLMQSKPTLLENVKQLTMKADDLVTIKSMDTDYVNAMIDHLDCDSDQDQFDRVIKDVCFELDNKYGKKYMKYFRESLKSVALANAHSMVSHALRAAIDELNRRYGDD